MLLLPINPTDDFIKNVVLNNFDYIQLHGTESEKRVKKIKSMGLKIIKAVKIKVSRILQVLKNMRLLIIFYLIRQVWKNQLYSQKN